MSGIAVTCDGCRRTFASKGNLGNHKRACRAPVLRDTSAPVGLHAAAIVEQPVEEDLGDWQQEYLETKRRREV
jgi:hypothetical protein